MARSSGEIVTTEPWTYRRAGAVEIGLVRGQAVALPAHFHDEDQITVVLSGRRRFLLGGETTTIEAGDWALIPAGSAHRSLSEPDGLSCLNLYVPAGDDARAAMTRALDGLWRSESLDPDHLVGLVDAHRLGSRATPPGAASRLRVAARAEQAGLSREGYSRAFSRMHGMPPHAFNLVTRLNHARRLLRHGAPIAAAAAEAGFADQSHLGRAFRRVFGVTPGRYRGVATASQTFQTHR